MLLVGVSSPSSQAIEGELFYQSKSPGSVFFLPQSRVLFRVMKALQAGVSGARAGRSMRAPSLLLARKNPCLCLQLYSH